MISSNIGTKAALTCCLFVSTLFIYPSFTLGDTPPLATKIQDWQLESLPTNDKEHLNISCITVNTNESLLVVGSDERSHIQVLKKTGKAKFTLIDDGNFPLASGETELDIEGIASDKNYTWVIGSHSMKRKSVLNPEKLKKKAKEKEKKGDKLSENYNHDRILKVAIEPTREWLYRLETENNGVVKRNSIRRGSLRDILANHPVLHRFRNIPSKENGIDIEGLAVIPDSGPKKTRLLVGLRGPSLRGPLAVVLEVSVKEDKTDNGTPTLKIKLKDTNYLSLNGRGIRGMSEMDNKTDGHLVLAGPVGDEPTPYMLYHWNKKDSVPEIDTLDAKYNVTELCQIPPPETESKAKAEGIHFLGEENGIIKFVIVYDSAINGAPTVFSCQLVRP